MNVPPAAHRTTPHPRGRRALAAALLPLALVVAGCGGDDEGADGTSTTEASGSTPSTAGPTTSAPTTSADPSMTVPGSPAPGPESAAQALAIEAAVIDVRTPEEFAAGHVEGATNLDVESGEFAAGIEELSRDQIYVVYCRSGNRSAVAAEQMATAGFTVLDGGGLDDMTAAGWPTA